MKKKVLSMLLCLSMAISFLPVTALAEDMAFSVKSTEVLQASSSDNPEDAQQNDMLSASELAQIPGESSIEGSSAEPSSSDDSSTETFSESRQDAPQLLTVAANVASVGSVEYATLTEALENAATGDTVKLLENIQLSAVVVVPAGKTLTLDLDGKTISVPSDFTGRPIKNEGILTITGNGVVDSSMSESGGYGAVDNYGTLTIENGTFRGSLRASGAAVKNRSGATLTINGGVYEKATASVYSEGALIVNGGTFITTGCSSDSEFWSYTINSLGTLVFNNGTVTGVQGALAISAGTGTINGGSFETVPCTSHPSGSTTFYALYVAGEVGAATATINGGTFTSCYRVAALIGNDNTNGDGGINAKATVNIYGGTFRSGSDAAGYAFGTGPSTGTPKVLGGTFYGNKVLKGKTDASLSDYTGGSAVTGNGPYKVIATAKIGSTPYATLADAVAAAKNGETVTLYADVTDGSGIIVSGSRNFTIDFNGHTYTVTGNFAGSSGTQNQCFQLLKGSAITMKNGTITGNSTGVKMIIQNYCDLTLQNMLLDATKGTNSIGYVLSCNAGHVNIIGNTTIIAKPGKVAFDACWAPQKGYPNGTQIVVDTTGTIVGNVEFDLWGADIATECLTTLQIKNAKIDGSFVITDMAAHTKNIAVTGGYYTKDPSAYVSQGQLAYTGTWNLEGVTYGYRVSTGSVTTIIIKDISTSVILEADNSVTEEGVNTVVDGNTLKLFGQISEGCKVLVSCTDNEGHVYSVAVTSSSGVFQVTPSVLTVGANTTTTKATVYNVDASGLELLPAVVKVAPPAVAEPAAPADTTLTGEEKKTAEDAVQAIKATIAAHGQELQVDGITLSVTKNTIVSKTGADGSVKITVQVGTEAGSTQTTVQTVEQVLQAAADKDLGNKILGDSVTPSTVKLVVQPVLDIQVISAKIEANGSKTLTLDVNALSQVLVTKIETDVKDIQVSGAEKNAIAVGQPAKVTVNDAVRLTIPLPDGFGGDNSLFADHTHNGVREIVKAVFDQEKNTASFSVNGLSVVKITSSAASCTIQFPNDVTQQYDYSSITKALAATPEAPAGKQFCGWALKENAGQEFITANGVSVFTTMTEEMLIALSGKTVTATAQFIDVASSETENVYTITATAGKGGYFSTAATVRVPAGDSAGFTITANKGYTIADVKVDGKSVGAVSTFVFTNVFVNHTITATFKLTQRTNPQTSVTKSAATT